MVIPDLARFQDIQVSPDHPVIPAFVACRGIAVTRGVASQVTRVTQELA